MRARAVARPARPAARASFGHQHGDALLLAFAEALRAAPLPGGDPPGGRGAGGSTRLSGRAGWPAFRLGGDKFALILPGLSARWAHLAVEDVRRDIACRLGGVTVIIGLSTLESGGDFGLLLEQAAVALYEAKRLGRDRTVHYAQVRGPAPIATPAQVAATRKLIAEGDVRVLFQPNVDRDRVLGYEALMRPPGGSDLA